VVWKNCSSQGLAASIIRAGNDISQTRKSGAVFRIEVLLVRWQLVKICKTSFISPFSYTEI
jgi:hypothetical protein